MISSTPDDCIQISRRILAKLPKASIHATCLALTGDLGAGKTTLVQYIAKELGIRETLPSPTFLLLRSYHTEHPIFSKLAHIDAYRIEKSEELLHIGWDDLIREPGTLIIVEWADRVADNIPKDAYWVALSHGEHSTRIFTAPWLE